jgi:hypothetical protein
MNLYVYHHNQQLGPFPLESVREMAQLGSVPPEALVWHEGAPEWMPLGTFLAQHPVGAAAPGPGLARAPGPGSGRAQMVARMAAATASSTRRDEVPSEGKLFLMTVAAAIGVAVVLGAAWAAIQCVTRIQLPYLIGTSIGGLCGFTVDKVSRGSAGVLYVGIALGACVLAWLIGIFGVLAGGAEPRIGIWTIVSFVFALALAWKAAYL